MTLGDSKQDTGRFLGHMFLRYALGSHVPFLKIYAFPFIPGKNQIFDKPSNYLIKCPILILSEQLYHVFRISEAIKKHNVLK